MVERSDILRYVAERTEVKRKQHKAVFEAREK